MIYTVTQSRTVTSEWHHIEANSAEEAIKQVCLQGLDPDETSDDEAGVFVAEEQEVTA